MLILKGTKTVDLSKDELTEIIGQFDRVHIDLGTGDGRNIYKLAINDQNTFYIGIDPVKENLFDISKKIIKKPSKGGLQPVEKPAPAIKPEQVFCLETKAETEKASKQQLHFSPILFVFRHPAPDGGHSISKWPAFSDSWQQI